MRNRLLGSLACLVLACLPAAAQAAPPATLPVLVVRLLPGTDPSVLQDLLHVRLAKGAEPATLQLDLARHRVLNAAGRRVADAQASRDLQSVVDKWRYVVVLEALARLHPQEVRAQWGDDGSSGPLAWVAGTASSYTVMHVMPQHQLLVFSIGPSGHIYLHHTAKIGSDGVGEMEVANGVATPPFGAETLVVLTAADPERMHELGVWLQEISEGPGPGLIDTQGELLKQIVALKDLHVGLVSAYSCRTAPECGS